MSLPYVHRDMKQLGSLESTEEARVDALFFCTIFYIWRYFERLCYMLVLAYLC